MSRLPAVIAPGLPRAQLAASPVQRGMTLVELVITIVVLGIAAAALFSAMAAISGRSADPMLRQQSLSIAEAYMEEISLQAFSDPDGLADCGRSCFDDVADYHGLSEAPHDARGNPIAALADYQVQVTVAAQLLGPAPGVAARHIQVRVTDPTGQPLLLDGYRGDY